MFINPLLSKQLTDQHRRDLIGDDQRQALARHLRAGSGTAEHPQPLTAGPQTHAHLVRILHSLTKVREWTAT
jgi:hypothetical protein